MTRVVAVALVASLAFTGCGSSRSDLEQTAQNLDDIRSGELLLKAGVEPRGEGEAFAYELSGPFQLPEDDGVAAADLRYRQTRGTVTQEAHLFAAGGEGWIEVDGERRELTEEQLQGLVVGPTDDSFLHGLEIDGWYVEPRTTEGDAGTIVISGDAHAGRTLVGLMRLAGGLGDDSLELDEDTEKRIDRLARTSRLEVVTGADDHLLRRLSYELDLGLAMTGPLRSALGALDGATITFELEIRSPNEPVQIRA